MSHVRKLFESCRCSPVWLVLGVYRQQIDRVYLQNFLSNKTHKNTISVDLRRIFLEFLPADGKLMASEAKAAGVAWGSCEECHWRRDKWCANGSLAASWSILPQFLHTISSTISSTISINFLEMKKMKFKRPVKIGWSWCFVYFCSHLFSVPEEWFKAKMVPMIVQMRKVTLGCLDLLQNVVIWCLNCHRQSCRSPPPRAVWSSLRSFEKLRKK